MPYFYELLEILIALIAICILLKWLKKQFISEPLKEKIATINLVAKTNEEIADEIKPVSNKVKQSKKKIEEFLKEGEKLND